MSHTHLLHLEFISKIERMNRTVQDKLTCALQISIIKSKQLWLFALSDIIMKLPRRHLAWKMPYYLWYGKHYDFSKSPLIPFDCRIMAHTPASLQTKLSHNAQLHYYVGSAPQSWDYALTRHIKPQDKGNNNTSQLHSTGIIRSYHHHLFLFPT